MYIVENRGEYWDSERRTHEDELEAFRNRTAEPVSPFTRRALDGDLAAKETTPKETAR